MFKYFYKRNNFPGFFKLCFVFEWGATVSRPAVKFTVLITTETLMCNHWTIKQKKSSI
jgi:hypothetical protein